MPVKSEILIADNGPHNKTRPDSFINDDEQSQLISRWNFSVRKIEKNGVDHCYGICRRESVGEKEEGYLLKPIEELHQESFVRHISTLVKEKEADPKVTDKMVRVLDCGGGIGIYAEQLRGIFGDKVKVTTTGLSPNSALKIRREYLSVDSFNVLPDWPISKDMHPDDNVCQSILQMSNRPEFDLILDTYGEQFYINENFKKKYFDAIINKLRSGGEASIVPFSSETNFYDIKDELEAKYPVTLSMAPNYSRESMEIEKLFSEIWECDPNNTKKLASIYEKSKNLQTYSKKDFFKDPKRCGKELHQKFGVQDFRDKHSVLKIQKA